MLKQSNENQITFLSQSVKVNGEKLPENKVADFYVEEKDKGGKLLSSNLKIRDLKSHEKMTVLIKASRTQKILIKNTNKRLVCKKIKYK